MDNLIGDTIYEARLKLNLTQDEFGSKFKISGPAVFKFEKGYVKPSLDLWLQMAKDFNIEERKAVLMWAKSRLPDNFQEMIDINSVAVAEEQGAYDKQPKGIVYAKFADRKEMRKALLKDESLPQGLKDMVNDEEIWLIYKPTGVEIDFLRNSFGKLGQGTKFSFREAVRLMREFKGEE